MLRTIAIALILVLSVGVMLPFSNEAHGVRQSVQVSKKRQYRYRSRAWWRRYRARLRQKREAAAALAAHRKAMLALPKNVPVGDLSAVGGPSVPVIPESSLGISMLPAPPAYTAANTQRVAAAATAQPVQAQPIVVTTESQPAAVTPNVQAAHATPNSATRPRVVGSLNASVKSPAATLPGQMSLSVVALSRPNPVFLTSREEKNMLAGLPVADLRRIVIDKMVAAGGWVTNDFIREVNGKRVFVVMARTPGDTLTPERAWTFYFTEAGGRIYGLTTDSSLEFADRMSKEADRYIETLRAKAEPISNK